MEEKNWLLLMAQGQQLEKVMQTNQYTKQYGLSLSEQDGELLVQERKNNLKAQKRIEFGEGILPKLIFRFCDSPYLFQETYVETIIRLQEIFYLFKNECMDNLTDDELLTFMRQQYESVCYGDLDYLENTCLERFSKAVRGGYRGFTKSGGADEYEELSEETRWDVELYQSVLKELFWE